MATILSFRPRLIIDNASEEDCRDSILAVVIRARSIIRESNELRFHADIFVKEAGICASMIERYRPLCDNIRERDLETVKIHVSFLAHLLHEHMGQDELHLSEYTLNQFAEQLFFLRFAALAVFPQSDVFRRI